MPKIRVEKKIAATHFDPNTIAQIKDTLLSLPVCNTIFIFPPLGNTYDRSMLVDEEEASIVLYDIWEQVRLIYY